MKRDIHDFVLCVTDCAERVTRRELSDDDVSNNSSSDIDDCCQAADANATSYARGRTKSCLDWRRSAVGKHAGWTHRCNVWCVACPRRQLTQCSKQLSAVYMFASFTDVQWIYCPVASRKERDSTLKETPLFRVAAKRGIIITSIKYVKIRGKCPSKTNQTV